MDDCDFTYTYKAKKLERNAGDTVYTGIFQMALISRQPIATTCSWLDFNYPLKIEHMFRPGRHENPHIKRKIDKLMGLSAKEGETCDTYCTHLLAFEP
jgi:hypothetical protein